MSASDGQSSQSEGQPAATGFPCSHCGTPISDRYYSLNTALLCAPCAASAKRELERSDSWGAFLRAGVYGFGGAIVGAIVFYGVIALTNLIIGFTAIVTGYIVGWSVRKGARGLTRRRYQWMALALTYFSVGLSIVPLAIQAALRHGPHVAPATAQSAPASADSLPSPDSVAVADAAPRVVQQGVPQAPKKYRPPLPIRLIEVAWIVLKLPVLFVFMSMPGGIISAFIIALGMRQAWQMTAGHPVEIAGPYRVGEKAA